jgi:hypothetical protein
MWLVWIVTFTTKEVEKGLAYKWISANLAEVGNNLDLKASQVRKPDK